MDPSLHLQVHEALSLAVTTLALPVAHEGRLLLLLEETMEALTSGRPWTGTAMLTRFSFMLGMATRTRHHPTRLRQGITPFERLAHARRGKLDSMPR
jgi:hypothetical protein